LNDFLTSLRNLGPVRLGAIAAVCLATLGFFAFISSRLSTPQMSLLYNELDMRDSGQIVQKLEATNVPYQLKNDGTQILVPADQVGRLRVAMAEAGLPHGGSVGYEIFDKAETLGTSNFSQNINQLRALEGELARTITSIGSVQGARVHLVLPKRELFSRERQEPSASIVLKLRGAEHLGKGLVAAIQHLTAAAVPGLHANRISIVDSDGNLLARAAEGGAEQQFSSANTEEVRIGYETRLVHNVEDILERTLGPGKVRVEAHADLDFDRVTTNSETFDPDKQVPRSIQSVNEESGSDQAGDQQVTVANNLPDAKTGNNGTSTSGGRSKNTRSEETTNYEIAKTVKNEIHEGGAPRRLSVAVVVDGTYTTGQDGARVYQARPQEEIDQITRLVRSAIGFKADRGDTVEVVNMRFAPLDEAPPEVETGPLGLAKSDLVRLGETAVFGLIGLLVLFLVVKPLLTRLLTTATGGGGGQGLLGAGLDQRLLAANGAGGMVMEGGLLPDGTPAPAGYLPSGRLGNPEDLNEAMIDLSRVDGRVRASTLKKIGEIVERHPEEAVAIVRSWMYENN